MHISTLRHAEAVRLDVDRLRALCDQLGRVGGETAICAAVEDIAALLNQAQAAWRTGDLATLRRCAGMIRAAAENVGMPAVASVARDAAALCQGWDDAALGAVMARLNRLGSASLLAVWEAQDLSM